MASVGLGASCGGLGIDPALVGHVPRQPAERQGDTVTFAGFTISNVTVLHDAELPTSPDDDEGDDDDDDGDDDDAQEAAREAEEEAREKEEDDDESPPLRSLAVGYTLTAPDQTTWWIDCVLEGSLTCSAHQPDDPTLTWHVSVSGDDTSDLDASLSLSGTIQRTPPKPNTFEDFSIQGSGRVWNVYYAGGKRGRAALVLDRAPGVLVDPDMNDEQRMGAMIALSAGLVLRGPLPTAFLAAPSPTSAPASQPAATAVITQMSVSAHYTCARMSDATVRCWSTPYYDSDRPKAINPGVRDIARVEAGDDYACGLRTDGRAVCWHAKGSSWSQGLYPGPSLVYGATDLVGLVVERHDDTWTEPGTCGLSRGGAVYCWPADTGESASVPLRMETAGVGLLLRDTPGNAPAALMTDGSIHDLSAKPAGGAFYRPPIANITDLAASADATFIVALLADGTVATWSGAGPAHAVDKLHDIVDIATFGSGGLALDAAGALFEWDANDPPRKVIGHVSEMEGVDNSMWALSRSGTIASGEEAPLEPVVIDGLPFPASAACPATFNEAPDRSPTTRLTCKCDANATQSDDLWGTGIYTADSSICAAALHAGLASAKGGEVTVEAASGCSAYAGSKAHGKASSDWGESDASFVFAGQAASCPPQPCPATFNAVPGAQATSALTCWCDASATASTSVWGSGVYTTDSSICAAAVHAGIIDVIGGSVSVAPGPGCATYTGSTANGKTSGSAGAASASFSFAGTHAVCPH
jgi:hypothetical protein